MLKQWVEGVVYVLCLAFLVSGFVIVADLMVSDANGQVAYYPGVNLYNPFAGINQRIERTIYGNRPVYCGGYGYGGGYYQTPCYGGYGYGGGCGFDDLSASRIETALRDIEFELQSMPRRIDFNRW